MSKRIAFINFLETITSFLRNDATAPRVWQLQDRNGTLADLQNLIALIHGNPLLGATFDRRYGAGLILSTYASDTTGVNTLRAHAMPIFLRRKVDIIQAEVTTLVNPSNIRLGIYRDNGNCYPGDLVVDSGALSGAALGVISAAIDVELVPGIYWLACLADANPQLRSWNIANVPSLLGLIATQGGTPRQQFYTVAQTYGALPDPFPAGATINASSAGTAQIVLRFSE